MTSNLQPTNQELGSFLTSDDIFSSTAYFSLTSSKNNIEHEVIEENFLHESMHFDMESLSLNLDFLESDFLDNEDTYVSSDEVQSQTTKNEDSVTRSNLSENESEDCTDYDTWVYQAIALEEFLEQFTTHQFSTHAIFEALFLSGGDLQQAAEVILTANNLVEKCRPCRHMLTGKCYRSDCVYDHDLSLFPCRFWMSPIGCIKFSEGQSCPFLHQIPSPYDHSHLYSAYFGTHGNSSNRGDSSEKYKAPALNDTDFPELLSMTTTKGPTGKSINTGSKQSTLSEATKIYKSMFSGHKNDDSRNLKKADSSSGAALSAISEPTSVKLTKAEKQKWLWQGTGMYFHANCQHFGLFSLTLFLYRHVFLFLSFFSIILFYRQSCVGRICTLSKRCASERN